jgi:hypothetical protein
VNERLVKVCVGFAGIIGVFFVIAAFTPTETIADQMQRFKNECAKTYGENTDQNARCFISLSVRLAKENDSAKLDRIYSRR